MIASSTVAFGAQPRVALLPARTGCSSVRSSARVAAVKQEVKPTSTSTEGAEEIYIGFPKNDYAPRAGRKGRVIRDDPKKYPGKDDIGPLLGAVGGWAGGETALWKLRESVKEELASSTTSTPKPKASAAPAAPKRGQSEIYVGFGKDELDLRKAGAKGRVIYDDPQKYPGKEDVGPLPGATGGFAGGERGIKAYLQTGEVRLRKPGEPGGQPMSPLTIAFIVLLAGTGGGLILTKLYDAGEGIVVNDILQAQIDDSTKFLLLGAISLLATAGGIAAFRAAQEALQARLRQSAEAASKLLVYAGFFGAVYVAARAVLEL